MTEQPVPEHISRDESVSTATHPPEKAGVVAIYLVEFKGSRKDHYRDPYHLPIRIGDHVIVQVERGEDLGRVVLRPKPADAARSMNNSRRMICIGASGIGRPARTGKRKMNISAVLTER